MRWRLAERVAATCGRVCWQGGNEHFFSMEMSAIRAGTPESPHTTPTSTLDRLAM